MRPRTIWCRLSRRLRLKSSFAADCCVKQATYLATARGHHCKESAGCPKHRRGLSRQEPTPATLAEAQRKKPPQDAGGFRDRPLVALPAASAHWRADHLAGRM